MWQSRFFVLRNRMLFYYQTKDHYSQHLGIKGVLNFQQVRFDASFDSTKLKIMLKMHGTSRVFILKCTEANDFAIWQKRITHAIDLSYGKANNLKINDYSENIN